MTKKERKKVYLKAYELMGNIPNGEWWACCPTIANAYWGVNCYEKVTEELFPEFFLLKPVENSTSRGIWFGSVEESSPIEKKEEIMNTRRTALLLAAEMYN